MYNIDRAREIASEFRRIRNQSVEPDEPSKPSPAKKRQSRGSSVSDYDKFLTRYSFLDEDIDGFSTKDLCFFFRKTAEDAGYKYFVSFGKDMHIFKMLRATYTNRDICGMIEFLYTSGQEYLSKETLSPNILVTKWVNTIYRDTQAWINDSYVPSPKRKPSGNSKKGEWDGPSDVSIGNYL